MAKAGESSSSTHPSNWNPTTDCPLFAMRFAEDLVNYVWRKLDLTLPNNQKRLGTIVNKQIFLPAIGELVFELIEYNIKLIVESYQKLVARGIHSMNDFRRELCMCATLYFGDGYKHDSFLIYSAVLVGVSVFYFQKGNPEMADASAQVLSYILNFYIYNCAFKPDTDWFNMCLAAQDMRRSLINKEMNLKKLFPDLE